MISFILFCAYLIGVAGHAQFYQKHMPEDIPFLKILLVSLVFPINLFMEIFQIIMGVCGVEVEYSVYLKRVTDEDDDNLE